MDRFEFEVMGMGFNSSAYPGAFTPRVEGLIKSILYGKVLQLFSGASLIGGERIDIEHVNATMNKDVGDFVNQDNRQWDWVLLDPPYDITGKEIKLHNYGKRACIASNVQLRRALKVYLQHHARNVLWLDICAPMIKGFHRRKLWLLLPGGFHTVRVLSWLERMSIPMELAT